MRCVYGWMRGGVMCIDGEGGDVYVWMDGVMSINEVRIGGGGG